MSMCSHHTVSYVKGTLLMGTPSNKDLFFFQAEDGIRDVERSRGLGDVYKRQVHIK